MGLLDRDIGHDSVPLHEKQRFMVWFVFVRDRQVLIWGFGPSNTGPGAPIP